MAQWLVLQPDKKVVGLIQAWDPSVWSLHVLLVSMWVFLRLYGFLTTKNNKKNQKTKHACEANWLFVSIWSCDELATRFRMSPCLHPKGSYTQEHQECQALWRHLDASNRRAAGQGMLQSSTTVGTSLLRCSGSTMSLRLFLISKTLKNWNFSHCPVSSYQDWLLLLRADLDPRTTINGAPPKWDVEAKAY